MPAGSLSRLSPTPDGRSCMKWVLLGGLVAGFPLPVLGQSATEPLSQRDPGLVPARNPGFLRALEVLRLSSDHAVRVRFEWEQMPGVTAYLLRGRWTEPGSWALRSGEYRVTPESGALWDGQLVSLELPLVSGSHSWSVVALRGRDQGDFTHPTRHSFEVR